MFYQPKLKIACIQTKRYIIISVAFLLGILNTACNHVGESEVDIYRIMNNSLIQAANVNNDWNRRVYIDLEASFRDMFTMDRARRWRPKVSNVKKRTDEIVDYLNGQRSELRAEAGGIRNYPLDSFTNQQLSGSSKLFSALRIDLKNKLQEYMNEVIDTIDVEGAIVKFGLAKLKADLGHLVWKNKYDELDADKISIIEAIAVFNACEADVRLVEHELIRFIYSGIIGIVEDFTKFSVILTMNSTAVRGGERIEVYGGVGEFSVASKPNFIIDGRALNPDVEGLVTYSIEAPMKKGKYTIPVKIKYMDSNGEMKYITKTLNYEVMDCNDTGH